MTPTQLQLPDPMDQRLKVIDEQPDWLLLDAMRKRAERIVTRFPDEPQRKKAWRFPTLFCGGDFLTDPASLRPEADASLHPQPLSIP